MKQSNSSTLAAFTLIEIIVVISLVGIVSLLGFTAYQKTLERNHLDQAALKVVSYLQDSQNNSILAKNGLQYGTIFHPDRLEQMSFEPPKVQHTYKFPDGLSLAKIELRKLTDSQPTTEINFAKVNGYPDASGELVMQSNKFQIVVDVSPSGQISSGKISEI